MFQREVKVGNDVKMSCVEPSALRTSGITSRFAVVGLEVKTLHLHVGELRLHVVYLQGVLYGTFLCLTHPRGLEILDDEFQLLTRNFLQLLAGVFRPAETKQSQCVVAAVIAYVYVAEFQVVQLEGNLLLGLLLFLVFRLRFLLLLKGVEHELVVGGGVGTLLEEVSLQSANLDRRNVHAAVKQRQHVGMHLKGVHVEHTALLAVVYFKTEEAYVTLEDVETYAVYLYVGAECLFKIVVGSCLHPRLEPTRVNNDCSGNNDHDKDCGKYSENL